MIKCTISSLEPIFAIMQFYNKKYVINLPWQQPSFKMPVSSKPLKIEAQDFRDEQIHV